VGSPSKIVAVAVPSRISAPTGFDRFRVKVSSGSSRPSASTVTVT
jgi:hypothetical protein